MNDISFTSSIRPVSKDSFSKTLSVFSKNYYVSSPWNFNSTRVGKNVYTMGVCDCTSCLITNGDEALLMHLNPDIKENHNFSKILINIKDNIDVKRKNLQAILIGSKLLNEPSTDIFNKLESILQMLKIPTTILQDGEGPTHLAYKTVTDEVFVTNPMIDLAVNNNCNGADAIQLGFKNISIAECDEIV